jgi:hypothetical protein
MATNQQAGAAISCRVGIAIDFIPMLKQRSPGARRAGLAAFRVFGFGSRRFPTTLADPWV